jgi:methylated-DNA-[protein]-cysteine S-methyltransferase
MVCVEAGLNASRVEDVSAFGDLPDRLRRYFQGERVDFSDVSLDLEGYSPFRRAMLLAARQIPHGEVATYGELAQMVGSPGAARAVGTAMSKNRTPIVVPCHRVIAAGGALGGFSGGLDWKRELLALEGAGV